MTDETQDALERVIRSLRMDGYTPAGIRQILEEAVANTRPGRKDTNV